MYWSLSLPPPNLIIMTAIQNPTLSQNRPVDDVAFLFLFKVLHLNCCFHYINIIRKVLQILCQYSITGTQSPNHYTNNNYEWLRNQVKHLLMFTVAENMCNSCYTSHYRTKMNVTTNDSANSTNQNESDNWSQHRYKVRKTLTVRTGI